MKEVTIYTDGACSGNPGPGGWAAVLLHRDQRKEVSGGEPVTTNNRMELQAAIQALGALKECCRVRLFSDSQYLRQGITLWIVGWKRSGWRGRNKKPIKNVDLWRRLDELAHHHQVTWEWLKGHAGDIENERCDELACAEVAAIQRAFPPEQLRALLGTFAGRQGSASLPPPARFLIGRAIDRPSS